MIGLAVSSEWMVVKEERGKRKEERGIASIRSFPSSLLGNAVREAPASRDLSQELTWRLSQIGVWETAKGV